MQLTQTKAKMIEYNSVTFGIMLVPVTLSQKMEDPVYLPIKPPQGVTLMEVVTENFACFHTKIRIWLF